MPCWYFEKKDLHNTVSRRDGVDEETEARYRREGARFIMDTGTKMGLSFETCATGVVYFHRFYIFHSFRAYHRYVTAACCLFLAGKVEETPKKCKDIIRITKTMLPDSQFTVFGDDPKEEVITLERILLQTIKFDLQVDHPYSWLLKFAKLLKGDKAKIEKMVQMSWTFINDSLCTTLSLQWEPEIIAIALIYLSSRLTKFEIQDWQGRPPHFKGKWWENIVEDITLELLEDICHQVLDLYSSNPKKKQDSPPPPPPKPLEVQSPHTVAKRPRSPTTQDVRRTSHGSIGQPQRAKATKLEDTRRTFTPTSAVDKMAVGPVPSVLAVSSQPQTVPPLANTALPPPSNKSNPYVSSKMYASSFMSQEGSQNIQSLIGGAIPPTAAYPPPTQYTQAPPAMPMTSYPAQPQQMAYQPPPTVYQTQTGYQQQAYQPYQASTQVSYSQPMPGYDASVAATQYPQSGYAGHYTAAAPSYPAPYPAAQPAPQAPQYQTAPPPAQAPQYPAYPPPTQPPPAPVNAGGYQGMGVPMQGYNPAHTTASPQLTNPGQPQIRMTGQHSNRMDRPATGHPLVRLTGRTNKKSRVKSHN